MDGNHPVRLTIPAKAEYISLGRLALMGLSRLRELRAETLADLKLALTEACSNSVRHAYGGGGGLVEIVYQLEGDRIVIEVSDNGEGFVVQEERPLDLEAELSEGGLGLAIIRSISDEFDLRPRADGRGSRLRFAKLLTD